MRVFIMQLIATMLVGAVYGTPINSQLGHLPAPSTEEPVRRDTAQGTIVCTPPNDILGVSTK